MSHIRWVGRVGLMHLIANQAYKLSFVSWGRSPHPTLGVDNPKASYPLLVPLVAQFGQSVTKVKVLGSNPNQRNRRKTKNNNQGLPIIIY